MKKIITHPILGDILYKKNKRSKRITIRVREGAIQVTLPYSATYQQAITLVGEHIAWIEQQLEKSQQRQQEKMLDWDTHFSVLGKKMQLEPFQGERLKMEERTQVIIVWVPQQWDLKHQEVQEKVKSGLIEVLRYFAKQYLPLRTQYWANYHQIKINKVYIKYVKTRWGSCSNQGNINLSLHLVLLPQSWIDYVICHELAHIAHPNHSPAFWAHLEELFPEAKQLDKALNQYQRPL